MTIDTKASPSLSTTLAKELYEVNHGLAPGIMRDIWKVRNLTYNFRKSSLFTIKNIKFVHYVSETLSFLDLKKRYLA